MCLCGSSLETEFLTYYIKWGWGWEWMFGYRVVFVGWGRATDFETCPTPICVCLVPFRLTNQTPMCSSRTWILSRYVSSSSYHVSNKSHDLPHVRTDFEEFPGNYSTRNLSSNWIANWCHLGMWLKSHILVSDVWVFLNSGRRKKKLPSKATPFMSSS